MKIRVAVFFGGESCEHDVSIISANQVLHALDTEKYEVFPVYITKDKNMYTGEELCALKNFTDLPTLLQNVKKVHFLKDGHHVYMCQNKSRFFAQPRQEIDVAFPVMHGTGGEDGTLQGYLESLGLPYTCSGVLGSAIGQDKAIMKEVLAYHHLPIVPWLSVQVASLENHSEEIIKQIEEKLGYPCIIKPANLGSSIGIEIAKNREELVEKMKRAGQFDFKLVIEKCLTDFKEINCSVMGDSHNAKASVTEEILRKDFLGFNEKYLSAEGKTPSKGKLCYGNKTGGAKGMASLGRTIPANVSTEMNEKIQELAVKVFQVLQAHGLVRIDFMVENEQIYVNEINSIPGSLAYYLWDASGLKFDQVCDELIRLAIKRQREKEKKVFSFSSNILKTYGGR